MRDTFDFLLPLKEIYSNTLFDSEHKSNQAQFRDEKIFIKEQTIKLVNYCHSSECGLGHCAAYLLGKCEELQIAQEFWGKKGKEISANRNQGN